MKKGEIILLRCANKKITPILALGKRKEKIIGLQVQGYSKLNEIIEMLSKERNKINKKKLEIAKEKLEKKTVIIGKPEGLRYYSAIKVNKEFVCEIENIIATISKINDKLFNEVLDKYRNYKREQMLHNELHLLKQRILRCQLNNIDYSMYENRLREIVKELGFPINYKNTSIKPIYGRFREVPTEGYIKIYRGGR